MLNVYYYTEFKTKLLELEQLLNELRVFGFQD